MDIKTIAFTGLVLAAVLASAVWLPKHNEGFDSSWECPSGANTNGAVVCLKKR